MKKKVEPSRKQAVETMRKRYGPSFFEDIAAKKHPRGFDNSDTARRAALKRWGKERSDNGKIS